MTALRALLTYEEILRNFQRNLSDVSGGIESTLESGLGYLMTKLKIINVGLFWWDAQTNKLDMEYAIHAGTLMEGEEEISIDEESPLAALVKEKKPVVISHRKPWIAYIPLCSEDAVVGAIRIERQN